MDVAYVAPPLASACILMVSCKASPELNRCIRPDFGLDADIAGITLSFAYGPGLGRLRELVMYDPLCVFFEEVQSTATANGFKQLWPTVGDQIMGL